MKKLFYASVLLLICQACQQKDATNSSTEQKVETSTEQEASTLTDQQTDEEIVVEDEQEDEDEKEVFSTPGEKAIRSYTDSYNLDKDLNWLQYAQKMLIADFDSIYGNSAGKDADKKADFMANILEEKYFVNTGVTTYDIIKTQGIQYSFLKYHLISAYKKLICKDKTFRNEIEKWYKVEKHLSSFMGNADYISGAGGSMTGIVCMSNNINLLSARLNDVNNLLVNCKQTSEASAKQRTYVSSDAQFHDLCGNVKTAYTIYCNEAWEAKGTIWKIAFNEEGKIIDDGGDEDRFKFQNKNYNSKGQLIEESSSIESTNDIYNKYEYNELGFTKKITSQGGDWHGHTTFTYNERLELENTNEISIQEGYETTENATYDILERDSRGNWTKRIKYIVYETRSEENSNERKEHKIERQIRKIIYQ